jgi:hypothetical protein
MLFFPQLSSGAMAQMPMRRETGYRTLVNQAFDGTEIRFRDVDFFERQWSLPLQTLSDDEWQAIQNLFAATEGRLQTFVFLEPGENLLTWSEDYTQAAWVKSGVSVATGIDDPLGGTAASEVTGSGMLTQNLAIPGWFRYAASIWVRTSQAGASLDLNDGASGIATVSFAADGKWRRYTLSTAWSSLSLAVTFTVHAPGGAVDVYGAQLEAQPMPSAYKKTYQQSGVHGAARVASDTLGDQATAPGEHSGTIQITWTPSLT